MRDGGVQRQNDRGDFRRGAQSEVDSLHIAVRSPPLEKLDQASADAHRRFSRIIEFAPRKGLGIEQEEKVDVRRIIELAAAELTHGDNREPFRIGVRNAISDRASKCAIDRRVGKVRQQPGRLLKRQFSGEIAERHGERQPRPLPPKLVLDIFCRGFKGEARGRRSSVREESVGDLRKCLDSGPQERGMALRAIERIPSQVSEIVSIHYGSVIV